MTNLLTIFLAVAITTHAAEPAGKKTAGPAKKSTQHITVKKTAGTQKNTTAEAETELIKKAQAGLIAWDLKLTSLKTKFTQEVIFSDAGLRQTVQGELSYLKPDLLKIEHFKPSRQTIYTDKKQLWVYKPEDKQAVRASWENWKKSQNGNFSGIMEFGNYSSLTEKHNAKASYSADGKRNVILEMKPKSNPARYTLILTLSSTDYFPAQAALEVDGTAIKTKLENPETNPVLSREIFNFSPPKGTEVLDFKN